MADKGNVSVIMQAGRVSVCEEITDLSSAFSLGKNKPFSLFIIPDDESQTPVIVNCILYQAEATKNVPFTPNCWDVPLVQEVSIDASILDTHSIYYGTGYEL